MATIHISTSGSVRADADIEPPQVNWLHSIGGAPYVPSHDRAAHALGLKHECARVRSGRHFQGSVENLREMRATLLEQYAAHTLIWDGDWSRFQ